MFGWTTLIGMNVSLEDTYLIMNNPIVERLMDSLRKNRMIGNEENYNNEAAVWSELSKSLLKSIREEGEGAQSFFVNNNIKSKNLNIASFQALTETIRKGEINPKDIYGKRNQLQILSFLWNASKAQTDIYLIQRLLSLEKPKNKIKSLIDYKTLERRYNELKDGTGQPSRLEGVKYLLNDPNIIFAKAMADRMGLMIKKSDLLHKG